MPRCESKQLGEVVGNLVYKAQLAARREFGRHSLCEMAQPDRGCVCYMELHM